MTTLLRRLLERGSRNVMLKRKMPARFGGRTIYVFPDAALRYWKPGLDDADPLLCWLASRFVKPGSVVWDAGANVGLFTTATMFAATRPAQSLPRRHCGPPSPPPQNGDRLRKRLRMPRRCQ